MAAKKPPARTRPKLGVPRTGQTRCWDTAGAEIDRSGSGQDGAHRAGVAWPSPRFTDRGDGTVADELTGLVWLKDADAFGELTWEQALVIARTLDSGSAGLSDGSSAGDWRLPTIKELFSLIDYESSDPILPAGHPFDNVRSSIYWTSTSLASAPTLAWMMTLGIGPTVFDLKVNPNRLWPVRGRAKALVPKTGQQVCWNGEGKPVACGGSGQDGDLRSGVAWPSPRFHDNGDGTVTDRLTDLVWLKNANAFGWRTWQQALDACNGLRTGAVDGLTDGSQRGEWRLPNIKEIESLVDYGRFGPCLPDGWHEVFENVQPSSYWTSTSVAAAPTEAMFIILGVGPAIFESKEHPFYVWPVRDRIRAEGRREEEPEMPDDSDTYHEPGHARDGGGRGDRGGSSSRVTALQTGQTACWDAEGREVSCRGTGQDAAFRAGLPIPRPRFRDNRDGTVSDRLTGLIWLADADAFGQVTWMDALANAARLEEGDHGLSDGSQAGDWRLPNINELQSLLDLDNRSGSALAADSPWADLPPANYWSSTSVHAFPALAWYQAMAVGPPVFDLKFNAMRMWPVRGESQVVPVTGQMHCYDPMGNVIPCAGTGQDGEYQAGLRWPSPRFEDHGDGTVTDRLTGLAWLKDGTPFGTLSWQDALDACNALASGKHGLSDGSEPGDWSLPNINELRALEDYGQARPALPVGHPFVNVRESLCWSSTTVASAPNLARFLFVGIGSCVWDHKSVVMGVWPVKRPKT